MRHELATAILGPVLLRQGRRIRRRINLLPEPESPRTGVTGHGPPLSVLIIGDSAGLGIGAPSQELALSGQLVGALAPHFTVRWEVAARSGATISATLRLLAERPPAAWDWIIASLGVNDVVAGRSLGRWRSELDRLQDLVDQRCGRPRLLFSGLPPMHLFPALPQPLRWYLGARAREFDRELARWAEGRDRCDRLPTDFPRDPALMATDGFHPGPGLYRLWGQAAAAHLQEQAATSAASAGQRAVVP